jgi:hypothetical protein
LEYKQWVNQYFYYEKREWSDNLGRFGDAICGFNLVVEEICGCFGIKEGNRKTVLR